MLSTPRALALAALVATGAVLLPAAPVAACSCMRGSVDDLVSAADVVFEGRFLGMEDGLARLALTRVWKGMADDVETARVAGVGPNSAGCEVAMEAREVYVVFASREGEALRTNACFGTVRADDAPELLAELGPGFVPVDPDVPPGPDVASVPGDAPRRLEPAGDEAGAEAPDAAVTGGCAHCAAGPRAPTGLALVLLAFAALRPLRRFP